MPSRPYGWYFVFSVRYPFWYQLVPSLVRVSMYVCNNSQSEFVVSKVFYKKKRERSESKKSEKLPDLTQKKEKKRKEKFLFI